MRLSRSLPLISFKCYFHVCMYAHVRVQMSQLNEKDPSTKINFIIDGRKNSSNSEREPKKFAI